MAMRTDLPRDATRQDGVMVAPGLISVFVLGGHLTVAEALRALLGLPDDSRVVIEECPGLGARRMHVVRARMLHQGLADLPSELSLSVALALADRTAAAVLNLQSVEEEWHPGAGTVVVDGDEVVGWVGPATSGSDGMRGDVDLGPRTVPGDASHSPSTDESEGLGRPGNARFRAFPELSAPVEVTAGSAFQIDIGFATGSAAGGDPVVIPGAPPVLAFEVQLSGFGFTFGSGATTILSVTRDSPQERVVVQVVADAVPTAFARSIEATFSLGGVPVGEAWCDVVVSPPGRRALEPAAAMTARPPAGGAELGLPPAEAPDLTVTIRSRQGHSALSWSFQTPHPVQRPSAPVLTELSAVTAQAFATQIIQQLSKRRDDPFLVSEVRGIGDVVAEQLPVEFWHVLADVLRLVPDGRTPTLLLLLDEAYVPWELALVTDRLPPDLIPDGPEIPLIGCLLAVSRWVLPRRQPLGHDRPATPPPDGMSAATMAVVVGDYSSSALRLEGAIAECAALVERYDALRVGIAAEEVHALVDDMLERDGVHYAPAVVHFALHGQTSPTQQQYVGLKIGVAGDRLLHPMTLTRSAMAGRNRPFVFLNACQVGSAMETLNSMGGLAPALVTGGARGVIGPLWDVDDSLAKDLSTTFYVEVLEQAVPVGEAMRRLRSRFGRTPVLTATPLAYVYYGHPALVLDRGPRTTPPDQEEVRR